MALPKTKPQQLRLFCIRRQQVQQTLAISALISVMLLSGCEQSLTPSNPANQQISALFYENKAQCEADAKRQQNEYSILLKAYQNKELGTKPKAPPLKPSDCAAQMLAAQREHDRHAPVYRTLADCQADSIECETTPMSYSTLGYRPVFGGSYIYPDLGSQTSYTYVNLGGTNQRVYQPSTVYRSRSKGQIITPQGQVLSKTTSGRVNIPQSTTISAPSRPQGHAARGTITGRSSTGFGSTFKSTGSGGK